MLQAVASSPKLHTPGRVSATGELLLPRGDHVAARRHRAWLKNLPALTGGTQLTTIAKLVGVSPSTLTRPASEGETGTSVLRITTIEKIITYFAGQGVAIPWPEGEQPVVVPLRIPTGFAEEAMPFDTRPDTPLAIAVRAMIAGRRHAMPVTLVTRALEGAGYLPGDVLIYDLNGVAQPGDVVRAQVYDRNGEIEETVWRVYDPPYLIGVTRDPTLAPKPLTEVAGRVVIMGVVTGMIRPPRARAA
jgi:hypothetical protein